PSVVCLRRVRDAACLTYQLWDHFLIELVVRQGVVAGQQAKLRLRHKRHQGTALLANRAIARHDPVKAHLGLIANATTMAATGPSLRVRHRLCSLILKTQPY